MAVEKKVIIMGTMNAQLKPGSKKMQRHSGEHQRRFLQSHDGIPHQGMGLTTISWPHVLPNLNSRGMKNESINNIARKGDVSIMHVGDTIMAASAEAGIDENWCLFDNQSTFNAFINENYLSNIRDAPYGKYLRFHCNAGVTHTKKIGDLPGYSDLVLYNPKGITNTLSLGLVQKNHPVTYNNQDGNEFVTHRPKWPTFKMTKALLFYHDMRNLLNNKDAHIMVNDSHSLIEKVQD